MEKSICVTGGASFIGSHLVEKLIHQGHQISVVDDLSSGKYLNLHSVKDQITFHKFNIKENPQYLIEIFRNCDTIFHLANAHGGRNFIDFHPAQCCANMAIDNLIFETAVKCGVKHVQYASSACVYSPKHQTKNEFKKLTENLVDYDDLTTADGEYGLAKLMAEISLHSYRKEFGLDGSIVRLSSVYGSRENETHAVIALIAKAFVKQEPYEIFGDGTQLRNFSWIGDIVETMILASQKTNNFLPINLGTEETITINELTELIFKQIGWKPKTIHYDLSKPEGPHSRVVDNTLAEELLGFKKSAWILIEDGISKTVEWYTQSHNPEFISKNLEVLLTER